MDGFYSVALTDPLLGHHFTELDLESHLPIIVDFWEKTLLGNPVYFRNPMAVHEHGAKKHPMPPEQFTRWVEIFAETVDSLFSGPTADNAKLRARMIADSMSQRINPETRFAKVDISRLTR